MRKFFLFVFISIFIFGLSYAQEKPRLLSSALEFFSARHFTEALENLEKLERESSKEDKYYPEIIYYKAKCYTELGKFYGAVYNYEKLVNDYKASSLRQYALYDLGKLYFEHGDYASALINFKKLITEYPYEQFYGSALFWAGESAAKMDFFEDAETYFNDAISMSFTNKFYVESIYALAELYDKNGNYSEAISYYDELLSYHSDSKLAPHAQLKIGEAYFKLGEYDNAILELSEPRIKKLDKEKQLEANYYIANSYFRLKEYDKALKIYRELLKTFPDEKEANRIRFNQAWINFQSGMYDEAYRIFNFLAKLAEGEVAEQSLYWAGEAKRYNGETELAKLIFKRFMQLYPESKLYGMANFNLGLLIYEEGDKAQAEEYLLQAINKIDGKPLAKAYVLLGEIYLEKKNLDKAEIMFKSAMKTKGADEKTVKGGKLGLGATYYYSGEYSLARKTLSDLYLSDKNFEADKVHFFLAETHFELGDYYSALEHYKKIKAKEGKFAELGLFGKAYSYFNLRNYPDAAYFFEEFLGKFPNSKYALEAKLRLADSYYGTKNFGRAVEIYEYAYLKNRAGMNDFAYFQYGKTLVNLKRNSDAVTILTRLQKRFPNSAYADDAQYLIGWIYFKSGNYRKAVEQYKLVLKKYPQTDLRPVIYSSLGDAYYNVRNYTQAVFYYKRLLDNYPKTEYVLDAVNGIQYAYIAAGNPDKAAKIIDEYVIRNPYSKYGEKIFIKKGEIYYGAGRYDKAILAYKEFIATYPSSLLVPEAYYWIGKSALNLNRTEEARYYFEYVVNEYANSASAISAALELGKIYSNRNEYAKAVEIYDKVYSSTEATEKKAELLYRKGLALIELGKIEDVYKTFNELTTEYPETIFAVKGRLELAAFELARGNYKAAEDIFSFVGKERSDDTGAQAQYMYGETLYLQKKYSEAISAFVRVVNVFDKYPEWKVKAKLRIGDCYAKLGNYGKAKKIWREVYSKHRGDTYGREARKKLRGLR
jgi:tetratricopeptide (TPR) repeat protein